MRRRLQLCTVVWLLLTTTAPGGDCGRSSATAAHRSQVRVARGLFTYIRPNDIPFTQSANATHCKISVDFSDLSTLQVGTVRPHVRTVCSLIYRVAPKK